jgi:hypothetical protein
MDIEELVRLPKSLGFFVLVFCLPECGGSPLVFWNFKNLSTAKFNDLRRSND